MSTVAWQIPLSAKAPEIPDITEQFTRMQQLKNMRQAGQIQGQVQQENDIKLQQMKQDIADHQTARSILAKYKSPEEALPELQQALGDKAIPLAENIIETKQKIATLNEEQAKQAKEKLQSFRNEITDIFSYPPEQRDQVYQNKIQMMIQSGTLPKEMQQNLSPHWDDQIFMGAQDHIKETTADLDRQIKETNLKKSQQEVAGTTPMTPYQQASVNNQARNVTEAELALKAAQGDAQAGKALGIMTANRIKEAQAKQNNGMGDGGGAYAGSLGPSTERNPDILKTLPTGKANQIQRMIDGREPIPSGMAMRTPYWQEMMRIAGEYEPGFDATQWRTRLDTRVDFAKGKAALQIRSLNTLIKHLSDLSDASDALDNTGITGGSKAGSYLVNLGKEQFGSEALKKWDTASTAAGSEMAALLKGAAPTDQEMEEQKKIFNRNDPKTAQKQAIKSTLKLAFGRLQAVKDQYEQAFKKQKDFKFLTPLSEKIARDKLGVDPGEIEGQGTIAQPKTAPPTNTDPRVKAYADKYFDGDVNAALAAIAKQRGGK
jgi:hypothetical protein